MDGFTGEVALFSACITPLLKTGSRNANASPTRNRPGAAQWREWRLTVVAVEEIERHRAPSVGLHEGNAIFFHEMRRLHLRDHPDALQRPEGEGNQRFADVIAWELLPLDHKHAMAVSGKNGGGTGAGRAASDEDCVVVVWRGWSLHEEVRDF